MLGYSMQAPQRSRGGGAMLAAMDVDDTLVLILERIDSPVTLIRAASTCRRWRRIIADAGFLRRCRSLHGPPPVAGDYYKLNRAASSPSFVPASSSSTINARHFSLDFVVDAGIFKSRGWESHLSWEVWDSRGSLLLMACIHEPHICSASFPELVVCEPLTRRYRIIVPRPPDIDAADCIFRGAYLVDGCDDEDDAGGRIGMSNFRVVCMFLSCVEHEVAYTTVFTAAGGDADSTWSEKAIDHIALMLVNPNVKSSYFGRALGSSYHYVHQDRTLITLDHSTGKFSSSSVLSSLDVEKYWDGHNWTQNFWVVDGGDGEPRVVGVTNHTMVVFARVDGGRHWGLENRVLLPKVTRGLPGYWPSIFDKPLTIMRRGVGFVVISPWELNHLWPFSVDLKTMEAAPATKVWERMMAYPCEFPWPPVLQVCLDS